MSPAGGVAEWSKATVLKTVGRKPRGFESLLLLNLNPAAAQRQSTRATAMSRSTGRHRRELAALRPGTNAASSGPGLRIGFLAASSLALLGCPNPNTYTTPRTIGSGHFQASVAVEAEGAYTPAAPSLDVPSSESKTEPMAPTCTFRLGLGDAWEIGARIGNMSSAGGDLKWNFLRSRRIDLALDPAFQVSLIRPTNDSGSPTTFSFYHLPLLVGVNLSRRASLVFTPGVTWGFASGGSVRFTNGLRGANDTSTGALGRFGVGADLRMVPGVTFHPEITFLRDLGSRDYPATLLYMAGIGFIFGAVPNYDDVGGGPPPGPPPAELAPPSTM
jgi:hypothetical protein